MCAREPKGTAHFLTSPKIPDAKGIFVMIQFTPVGDSGVLAVCGSEISEQVNAQVMALDAAVQAAQLPGVVETVPTYAALLVTLDPLQTDADTLIQEQIGSQPDALYRMTQVQIIQQMTLDAAQRKLADLQQQLQGYQQQGVMGRMFGMPPRRTASTVGARVSAVGIRRLSALGVYRPVCSQLREDRRRRHRNGLRTDRGVDRRYPVQSERRQTVRQKGAYRIEP